jgi:hypothetical protein
MGYETIELGVENGTESSNAIASEVRTVSLKDKGSSARSDL